MVNTGYKQSVYFGEESSYGSTATVDQPVGLVQSISPTETNSLIQVRTIGGSRDYSNIVPGMFEVTGSMEYFLQGGAFLRQAIGEDTATTSTIDSGPKVHTGNSYLHVLGSAASPTANAFPSFTLEFADDEDSGGAGTSNLNRKFNGCRINSLTLSATVDEPVRVSADWQAQDVDVSTAAATSVTESSDDPYVFYQGQVYATSGSGITAYQQLSSDDALCLVNSLDFTVNNNLEASWYVSGTCSPSESLRGLKSLIPQGRDYEASLELNFEDKTMYERFLGATGASSSQSTLNPYAIVVDFVRSGTIGATPKQESDEWIRVVMQNCKFNENTIPGNPTEIVTQSLGVFVESAKIFVVDDDSDYTA